jgi:hypothetical protein
MWFVAEPVDPAGLPDGSGDAPAAGMRRLSAVSAGGVLPPSFARWSEQLFTLSRGK